MLLESARYLGTDITSLTTPVTNEYRAFSYDPIGNRETLTEAASTGTYATNALNQYTNADLPLGGSNTFTHDEDGNLTEVAGIKNAKYVYNAENRLVSVESSTPSFGSKKLDFTYDYQGRRIRKLVSTWNGSTWASGTEKLFLYDGWNLIQEITPGDPTTYYVWGIDLSGSLQGAGGVGGLLTMVEGSKSYAYFHDGNGNVGQLVDTADGSIDAHYEYDPYGNEIAATGPEAESNPFRFSTKYLDEEFILYYYGYRYYDPETGRWLTRDPIEEEGGLNLYGFILNNPASNIDFLGMYTIQETLRLEGTRRFGSIQSVRGRGRAIEVWLRTLSDQDKFDIWYAYEIQDTGWTARIPLSPKKLCIVRGEPQNPDPNLWEDPELLNETSKIFHPNAVFEMRSKPVSGGYGNQATYDEQGNIISSGISAGTADRVSPVGAPSQVLGHFEEDVLPFILGAQLDGNTIDYRWFPFSFTGMVSVKGINLIKYFEVRPTLYEK